MTARIRLEEVDERVVESAATRVWARLSKESVPELPETKIVDEIHGCAEFQALIPAYLKKDLSEARILLLEGHMRECIPCRKVLKVASDGCARRSTCKETCRNDDASARKVTSIVLGSELHGRFGRDHDWIIFRGGLKAPMAGAPG